MSVDILNQQVVDEIRRQSEQARQEGAKDHLQGHRVPDPSKDIADVSEALHRGPALPRK